MIEDQDEPILDRLIVTNQKLEAVVLIRKQADCGIPEAMDILVRRYRALREKSPERFSFTHEDYWKGFES